MFFDRLKTMADELEARADKLGRAHMSATTTARTVPAGVARPERLDRGIMAWHASDSDPTTDRAAANVLAAYEAAWQARKSTVDCYRAGVEAWRRVHPEQTLAYTAQRAVSVILAAKVSLRIPDE
jgi:hypothetical protein